MGSASSKAAKTAANVTAVKRQYPTRIPQPPFKPPPASTTPTTSPTAEQQQQQQQQSSDLNQNTNTGPSVHPHPPQASQSRNAAIDQDASDPHFAANLRSLGPVTPSSTRSNSSTFVPSPPTPRSLPTQPSPSSASSPLYPSPQQNPALQIHQARERLAAEAERELTSRSGSTPQQEDPYTGKKFLDISLIREALVLRDAGELEIGEVERKLGLRRGVMGMLGRVGVAATVEPDAGSITEN